LKSGRERVHKLAWKKTYSVGVAEIDGQHQRLLELINELYELQARKSTSDDFFAILNALVKYAEEHFATEEEFLVKANYPETAQQQRQHVRFVADVFRFAERLKQDSPRIRQEIVDFLVHWYSTHILKLDQEYKEFLRQAASKTKDA
jgi:hemerythrin